MKFKNILLGTMLTIAIACGAVAAYPVAVNASAFSDLTAQKMNEQVFVKTQKKHRSWSTLPTRDRNTAWQCLLTAITLQC